MSLLSDLEMTSIDDLLIMRDEINMELSARAAAELAAMDKRREQLQVFVSTVLAPKDELAARRSRAPGVAKYRNPANPDQTWTGRGKKPGWLTENPEDCAIPMAA